MTALVIDTLEFARNLEASGMPKMQAEATVKMVAGIVEDNLATKQDLDLKIAELKNELIKWVFGISFGQAAIIISCMKFIHS